MSTSHDNTKLYNAVIKMIDETLEAGKTLCMFNQSSLLSSLQVSQLKLRYVHSEISDILCGRLICTSRGMWVTGEYESDIRFLVRLAGPKEEATELAYNAVHKAASRADRLVSYMLDVPKGISEEQAQQFVTQACSIYMNTGTIDELLKAERDRESEKPQS